MTHDVLGDLREWGEVLKKLDELARQSLLDEHQMGMARILRYRRIRPLNDRVLTLAQEIQDAHDVLIAEVLYALVDEGELLDTRILAAGALAHLVPRRRGGSWPASLELDRIRQILSDFARTKGPPVLVDAVKAALEAIGAP